MATQTPTFVFGTEGWAAVMRRRGDAHAGVTASYHELIPAGLAGHGE